MSYKKKSVYNKDLNITHKIIKVAITNETMPPNKKVKKGSNK